MDTDITKEQAEAMQTKAPEPVTVIGSQEVEANETRVAPALHQFMTEEMLRATAERHRAVQDAAEFFTLGKHLQGNIGADVSGMFHWLVVDLLDTIKTDSPHLTRALSDLMSAKDNAVRAALKHEASQQ